MDYNAFRSNITSGLIETLSTQLGVTAKALRQLEVGFLCGGCVDDKNRIAQHAFTFPEIDEHGEVIGILRRFWNGKKFMIEGSQRGLYYCNKGFYLKTDAPYLVVEGASDTAAGLSLGFQTIGKPSAVGGIERISELIKGHSIDIVVVGENDPAGISGMQKTHAYLSQYAKSCRMILPPEGTKDLRAWLSAGLTHDKLMDVITRSDSKASSNMLASTRCIDLADSFIDSYDTPEGLLLRKFKSDYYIWEDGVYHSIDKDTEMLGDMHRFFRNKTVQRETQKGIKIDEFDLTTSRIRDIFAAMNTRCPTTVSPPGWLDGRQHPSPSNVIAFRNGILDVEAYMRGEIKLIAPTPKFFTLARVKFDFDPTAKCPLWNKFVNEVFENDMDRAHLLQEWFGYNIVADTSFEKLMMFIGRSGAGKGTILEVMQSILYGQCVNISLEHMASQFGLAMLIGKLAAIIGDGHVTAKTDARRVLEVLKAISGRDGVPIDQKYKMATSYQLNTRFTMAVNDMPDLKDEALALRRRLLLISFDKDFTTKPDTKLKDKLVVESPGIILWALEGLRRLRTNDNFTEPKSSGHVKAELERTNSPVLNFVHDCCDLNTGSYCDKGAMYNAWKQWAKDQDIAWSNKQKFGRQLCVVCPTVRPDRRTDINGRINTYENIRLSDSTILNYF